MCRNFSIIITTFCLIFGQAFASGGTTHLYIADQTLTALPDGELKTLLTTYKNDYYVGSNYPDSGYIKGASYGENSHWDPFIDAYIEYLHQHYQNVKTTQPRLIAFLMGVATHRVADELWHWTFLHHLAAHDFNNKWEAADDAADFGFDIILAVDQHLNDVSIQWEVPVDDLVSIYQLMGTTVTKNEINLAGFTFDALLKAERVTAQLFYARSKAQMPWGYLHYQDDKIGGIAHIKQDAAAKLLDLWSLI